MNLFASVGGYFALDVGTTAVRAVQLSGEDGNWTLTHYGTVPIDRSLSVEDESGRSSLKAAITAVIGQSGIHTKNVIIGMPSNRVFAAIVDMPDVPAKELAGIIERQAGQYTHTDTDEIAVDWAVLGKSSVDPGKNEVLLASVAKTFISSQTSLLKDLGFNVAAIEPDALALTRALMPAGLTTGCLIMEVGDFGTDIVVAYGDAPRSLCSFPIGMQTLVGVVSRDLKVESVQATQFILKFGMQPDKLEGHVRSAMEPVVYKLVAEIVKSISLFQARYPGVAVSSIILSGYGVTIPRFSDYVARKTGMRVELGNPWQGVKVGAEDRAQLQSLSSQFAVAIGLAQRGPGV